jgi:lipopolysaccharide export LptBFGC system permease protein LptF
MTPTLFWYVFKDLLRIFLLTVGGLAGIMSFAGLLRPLTEHGLDGSQVGQMLAYLTPAMMTYSLPIAALFATTMVYGRLSADNELTACRASGVSHLAMAVPALVLGLTVAIVSLLFLSFVVPVFTLKVERVIYSNLARLVANKIERNHSVRLGDHTIFAQEAHVPAVDGGADDPAEQIVILRGLMILTYEPLERDDMNVRVPREFWMARQATAYIRQESPDDYTFDVELEGGMKFPRRLAGGVQGGIETLHFGPLPLESPIRERTKFMDIRRLKELHDDLGRSSTIRRAVRDFIENEQRMRFLEQVAEQITRPERSVTFASGQETMVLSGEVIPDFRRQELVLVGSGSDPRPVRFQQLRDGRTTISVEAAEVRLRVRPDNQAQRLAVSLELHEALVHTEDAVVPRAAFPRNINIAMPTEIAELQRQRSPEHYVAGDEILSHEHRVLKREMIRLRNGIRSEMHARASFATSCFVLVMVGSALGMMFRSGNFLSAFALSVIPALATITLIINGQRTAEHIPWTLETMHDPLNLGLGLIWSGNLAVLVIGVVLLGRLQRQ